MENKKLTKKEKFAMIKEYIQDNEMLMEFIDNEINLLTKKASSSAKSKTQVENENIKVIIVNLLKSTSLQYTITDFQNAFEEMKDYSNQKLSALFTQLHKENKIERIVDKKKTYFKAI
jgi:calcineurin-like phosphoesterase